MTDPDITEAFTDTGTGVEFECIRTTDCRFIWGAWHPAYMGKPGMAVGDTAELALKRLRNRRPEIFLRLAA